jgi:hypothetical protein
LGTLAVCRSYRRKSTEIMHAFYRPQEIKFEISSTKLLISKFKKRYQVYYVLTGISAVVTIGRTRRQTQQHRRKRAKT